MEPFAPARVGGQCEELAARFFAAVERGDTEGLVGLLAADAVLHGDGAARPRPSAPPSTGPSGSPAS